MRFLVVVMAIGTLAACGDNQRAAGPDDAGRDAPQPDAMVDAGSSARCNDPSLGQPCQAGLGSCQRSGTWQCNTDGTLACSAAPGAPVDEICNGLDDNCDGQTDEGFDLGAACEVGVGACLKAGVQVCDAAGATRCDAELGAPTAETCNELDDDCDGIVDNVAGLGEACTADAPGLCARGHQVCRDRALACAPGEPAVETCDGLDDDCDGVVNNPAELGARCETGALGICAAGSQACGPDGLLCVPTAVATAEICNGLDDDCDGTVDDACLPTAPSARWPWNGVRTGSLWTLDRGGATPLRPRFTWLAAPGASSYDLQVDDSCDAADVRGCAFPSPEIAVQVGETSYQPAQALAVSTTAPVGRRYYWRVRACTPTGCSAYTEARYVDVGRVAGDINGDGYPDLLAGVNRDHGTGTVYVYQSGPAGLPAAPTAELGNPGSGTYYRSGTIVGDLNGDGFDDVIVAFTDFETYEGVVYEYDGAATGLASMPSRTLRSPLHGSYVFFGAGRFSAGDLNGDGVDDLVIGAFAANRAYLYLGTPAGLPLTPSLTFDTPTGADGSFGATGATLGDIDGDGYPDLAIGAPDEPHDSRVPAIDVAGAFFLYRGGRSPSTTPFQTIRNTIDAGRIFFAGTIIGGFDRDHDGLADVAIAPRTGLVGTPYPNAVYVYQGSPTGLVVPPSQVVRSPRSTVDSFAYSVAIGDVNGDGQPDLLTGDYLADGTQIEEGIADLFLGNAGGFGAHQAFANPQHKRSGFYGQSVLLCDFNADGYDDRAISAPCNDQQSSCEGIVYVYAGGPGPPTTTPILEITSPTHAESNRLGIAMSCGR